jgi:hypothetical protein
MFRLFQEGLIGTKEFRNWLTKVDEDFASVRDTGVDNEIDRIARERAEALRQYRQDYGDTPMPSPELLE